MTFPEGRIQVTADVPDCAPAAYAGWWEIGAYQVIVGIVAIILAVAFTVWVIGHIEWTDSE